MIQAALQVCRPARLLPLLKGNATCCRIPGTPLLRPGGDVRARMIVGVDLVVGLLAVGTLATSGDGGHGVPISR